MVGITDVDKPRKRKSHVNSVMFSEEEEIINPEDVDPSIGKFRNMIQTTIIPTKVSVFTFVLNVVVVAWACMPTFLYLRTGAIIVLYYDVAMSEKWCMS